MGTFTTPYEQHSAREGQHYELVRFITEPEADVPDEEVLPMAVIRFDDGFETQAWPEELGADDLGALVTLWREAHPEDNE